MRIIYKNSDESISVLVPTPQCLEKHELKTIALKDVPEGLPFWLVEDEEVPADRTFRQAWEIPEDYREPDGYGAQSQSFEEIEDAGN